MVHMKFKRFNDITKTDLNFDFHMHTVWSDGESRCEDMIKQAKIKGLKKIAITDHVRRDTKWFDNFKNEIESFREGSIEILVGFEAKALDYNGNLDATQDMIKKADIVVGTVHRYPDGKGGLIPLTKVKNLGMEKAAENEFKLALGLVGNKDVDVLGHPFGVYSKNFKEFPKHLVKKILEKSLETGVAIEINAKYKLPKEFFELLREINPYVSFGSDAHTSNDVGKFDDLKDELP